MIRVTRVLDDIANKCFTREEKEVLEFTLDQRQITVQKQFKYYYKTACYDGELDDLLDAICIIKQQNIDLFEQMVSLYSKIKVFINPHSFDKVFVRSEEGRRFSLGSSMNAGTGDSSGNASSDTTSDDTADSWSLADNRAGTAETDSVEKKEDVWNNETLIHSGENQGITTGENKTKDLKYRVFDTSGAKSEDTSKSHGSEQRRSHDESHSDSYSADINSNKSDSNRLSTGRSYVLGDQLLNSWKEEMPKLKNKFWLQFHGLFIYERYY